MRKVEVIWLDATIEEAHIPLEVAMEIKPLERRNIGYCISQDDDVVRLTFGMIENFHKEQMACDMVLVIPKVFIKEIRELTEQIDNTHRATANT